MFLDGFLLTFALFDNNFATTILYSYSYFVVANSPETADESVAVAGPTLLKFPFDAKTR